MKDNLYRFFNCESKEELYEKVRSNDSSVASLSDFIDYSKGDVAREGVGLTSPNQVVSIAKNHLPKEGESKILFVNTKNIPVHVGTVFHDDRKSFRSVLRDGLGAGASHCFTINRKVDSFGDNRPYDDTLNMMGISPLDAFVYDERNDSIYSFKQGRGNSISLQDVQSNCDAVSDDNVLYENGHKDALKELKGFNEFSAFYANKEVTGLNIFDEVDDVQEALKVGYQFEYQEVFGIIMCDSEGFVKNMSEVSRGGVSSAVVDPRVCMNEIFQHDDVSYVAVFHNHPSGNPLNIVS